MPLPSSLSMCCPFPRSDELDSTASAADLVPRVAEDPVPPLVAPTADMTFWHKSDTWRQLLQRAVEPAFHGGWRNGLHPGDARKMARALAALPADLLLPDEVAKRDIAMDLLRTAPSPSWLGVSQAWRITVEQGQRLWDGLYFGNVSLLTGPESRRRLRSSAELAALRGLVQWARDGGDPRQRAVFIAALRTPAWRGDHAIVHWQEPADLSGELGPLDLPPRHLVEALTAQNRPSLVFQTHSLRIDDPARFADSLAAFGSVTLQLLQIPSEEAARRMPGGITSVDISRLPGSFDWSDLAPLGRFLPNWPNTPITYRSGQLPPDTIEDFERLIRAQILHVGGDKRDERQQTLQRVLVAAREQPELSEGIRTALQRNRGDCLDANLMRLEEIEALVDAGKALRPPADRALFFFRQALKWRAQQTAAGREQNDKENLEIGHGLAWAVDRRLVDLLGVSPSAAEPVYRSLARLPGWAVEGKPVNDARAADAVIAAEIRGGFPVLAFIAAGGHPLSASMNDALEEDPGFVEKRKAIDDEFQLAYTEAFNLAPDDPDAGTEAFRKKEEDLIRTRVDRLAHHLQPALAKLHAAGIGAASAT